MVEREIQTVKQTLKKAFYDKKDPYLAILELMNTPIAHDIKSPNQILLGRNVTGVVPDFLDQNKLQYEEHKQKLKKRQDDQKRFHDRRARDLSELQLKQKVRVQKPNGQWDRAVIVDKNNNGRSYTIKTEDDKD